MPTRLTTAHIRFIRDNLHLSDRELAERLGVTRSWVTQTRKRYGLIKLNPDCRNNRGISPSTKQFIIDNHPQISIKKLSKITGHARETISKFINN